MHPTRAETVTHLKKDEHTRQEAQAQKHISHFEHPTPSAPQRARTQDFQPSHTRGYPRRRSSSTPTHARDGVT
ncbi:hypothetical protein DF3PB_10067 [uncultured Defluviicoccus sp.]|uniref:Uncharacterized protein n=1 Tax=metagenome TaxID=256318 RepID=A0A380T9H6_9ZZZZ|nr:hypothetical protein DF3PB_10067 [uncultured Defluviicoccus sp.]